MENLINPEFEQLFLGQCLVDSNVLLASTLTTNDFGIVAHQLIYAAIITVYEEVRSTDPVLVAEYLKKSGELNRVGGHETIYELQAPIVETESAVHYEQEIRQLSTKRKICALASKAISQAQDMASDPEQVAAQLETDLASLQFEQEKLESYTALELSKMKIEPVKWFIPDFLPSGLTILAGPPKIGKSFFCWNMALAIATGGVAFSNIIIPDKYNVSYLSLEDPPALLKDRLSMMSDEAEIMPSNLHIINDMQGKKLDAVGLKILDQHLDETASELLIVDTWMHVSPNVDVKGTAYDIDYNALIPIQKFAHRRNMAVVLVTHTRKAADIDNVFNQIQGSVGMQAACDTLMMLSHDSGSKTLHLSGRRIENNQFAFTINDGIWKLEGDAEAYHGSELRREIFAVLKDAGENGLSIDDIEDLTNKSRNSIKSALRRMVKAGEINQPKKRGDYFYKDDQDEG